MGWQWTRERRGALTCFEYTMLKQYLATIRRWYQGTPPRDLAEESSPKRAPEPEQPTEDDSEDRRGDENEARTSNLELAQCEFAANLQAAQVMWRRYPHLVEAEDIPEPFRSAFIRERKAEPHAEHIDVWDGELVKAGILPKPRRMRFSRAALEQVICKELASSFDEIAQVWADRASATDLAVMHALLNTNRKPLDVLQNLLVCDSQPGDEEQESGAEATHAQSL